MGNRAHDGICILSYILLRLGPLIGPVARTTATTSHSRICFLGKWQCLMLCLPPKVTFTCTLEAPPAIPVLLGCFSIHFHLFHRSGELVWKIGMCLQAESLAGAVRDRVHTACRLEFASKLFHKKCAKVVNYLTA